MQVTRSVKQMNNNNKYRHTKDEKTRKQIRGKRETKAKKTKERRNAKGKKKKETQIESNVQC